MGITVVSCSPRAHSSPKCRGQVWGYVARGSWSSSCKGLQGGQGQPDVGWQLFCYPVFPCTIYFCRGLSLCAAGGGAGVALLPQAELCPFHGSLGLVFLAGKITWLLLNLSLPSSCSSLIKLAASAYVLLWFFCCCFPRVCNKISAEGCWLAFL